MVASRARALLGARTALTLAAVTVAATVVATPQSAQAGTTVVQQWGAAGDIPVPGRYTAADHYADFAVYRPSSAAFYVISSGTGKRFLQNLGSPYSQPVPADYDGDGITDFAVRRNVMLPHGSVSEWTIRFSSTGTTTTIQWGVGVATAVPADLTGDGVADLVLFYNGTWWWRNVLGKVTPGTTTWGTAGDKPVVADLDLNGPGDLAVYRPSTRTWWIKMQPSGTVDVWPFGTFDTDPVLTRLSCLGRMPTDFEPTSGWWSIPQTWSATAMLSWASYQWGTVGDIPVPENYLGDDASDLAIWRPSEGNWYVTDVSTGCSVLT